MRSADNLIVTGIKPAKAVTLSFFHPKEGPIVGFLFPRDVIANEIQTRISEIIDKTYEEGFYTHSFGIYTSLDYFFEINSDWARGHKELVVLSTIFDEKLHPDLEYSLRFLSIKFAKDLTEVRDIFKGFYLQYEKTYLEPERANIRKMDAFILQKVEMLFSATNEKISEKIFENQMTSLSFFTEDDASPIRWSIGEEGIKILLTVLHGARTREEIATQNHISPQTISKHIPLILSLDLATEGLEILLTNRGLKFLGLVGKNFEEQYKNFEIHSFALILSKELVQILNSVLDGAKTPQEISVFGGLLMASVRKWLSIALNYELLSVDAALTVTARGIRFLTFANQPPTDHGKN